MNRTTRRRFLQTGAAGAASLALPIRFARAAKKGGVMRMGKAHGGTVDSLDPGTHENGFTIAMTHGYNIYHDRGRRETGLAESASSRRAGRPRPTSRPGPSSCATASSYHNGREVTAEDVVASINHHRGEASTSAAKPIVAPITDIKADGKHTVVFTLRCRQRRLPLHSQRLSPCRSCRAKAGKADWQSGIGAGCVQDQDVSIRGSGSTSRGTRDYWDSGREVTSDAIQMLTIVDPAARTNAVITGEVDAIDRVDLKTVHLLKRRQGLTVHSIAGTQHYTFPMRTNVAPLDDNNVRMALKHAINREEMVEKILQGFGVVGNDHPIGPGQRFFAKDLEQRTYDPDKAKYYLKQADMDSLTVDLSVADAAFAGAVDAGALFAETAKEAGINLTLVREPNDGYWSNVWNKKPFCACYWGGRPTADWMFATAYEAGVPWNDAAWEHEKFNKMLIEARAELDEAKRRTMYAEMQQIVRDEGGTIIPMFASYVFATSDKLALPEQMASNWDLDGEHWMERWSFA